MLTRGSGRDDDLVGMGYREPDITWTHADGAIHGTDANPRVGSFRFWFEGQRWEWSDEVYRIYGYVPGSVEPTAVLMSSHQHPDERDGVEDFLDQARYSGASLSTRHRLCDTAGQERNLLVVAERMLDETDAVVGASGHFIDLTAVLEQGHRDSLDKTLPKVLEARAVIEQAKGALRLVYGMNDEQAFKLLQWRSQENNTKLRELASQLVTEIDSLTEVTSALRTEFDRLIMTVHERVNHRS